MHRDYSIASTVVLPHFLFLLCSIIQFYQMNCNSLSICYGGIPLWTNNDCFIFMYPLFYSATYFLVSDNFLFFIEYYYPMNQFLFLFSWKSPPCTPVMYSEISLPVAFFSLFQLNFFFNKFLKSMLLIALYPINLLVPVNLCIYRMTGTFFI